jgi:hypothetical protein
MGYGPPVSTNLAKSLGLGALAGAGGVAALNTVTYLDMAIRGRAASDAPAQLVGRLAPGEALSDGNTSEEANNRRSGVGSLLGLAVGVGLGAGYGVARHLGVRVRPAMAAPLLAVVAMAASDVPLAVTRVSDPARWSPPDWLSDVIPHLAYGAAVAWAVDTADPLSKRRRSPTAVLRQRRRDAAATLQRTRRRARRRALTRATPAVARVGAAAIRRGFRRSPTECRVRQR